MNLLSPITLCCSLFAACAVTGQTQQNAVRDFEGSDAILIADFEGETYAAGWEVAGTAFGSGPARGKIGKQMNVTGYLGAGLVNTFNPNDNAVGTLVSPVFTIEKPYIRFLIGGGGHTGETCVNLLVDGKVVRTATGPNTAAGGSEALAEAGWDVRALQGRQARIQIVDSRRSGWGHLNVDHIIQSGRAPSKLADSSVAAVTVQAEPAAPGVLDIPVRNSYLIIPVNNGKGVADVGLFIGGERVNFFSVDPAAGQPQRWAVADVSAYKGKTLRVSAPQGVLSSIQMSDEVPQLPERGQEALRPQLHYTPNIGWINDPNGMVYDPQSGEWHLFYQYNPYGHQWGNISWGHAVSKDLVHWEELDVAIPGRAEGGSKGMAYSGSAIIDADNTAGFGKGAMLAFYTDTEGGNAQFRRAEVLSYSMDGGRTFTYYEGNPLLPHQGRDPKVFWHEPTQKWVMVVYNEKDKKRNFHIHTSTDLTNWQYESEIAGYDLYECPELFELPLEGVEGKTGWVALEANYAYLIGDFDGREFSPWSSQKLRGQYGSDRSIAYAAQTFTDAPDGRRIAIAWIRHFYPSGATFNGAMSVPLELSLKQTALGPRLRSYPVRELESLRSEAEVVPARTLTAGKTVVKADSGDVLDIEAAFNVPAGTLAGLKVHGVKILYDATTGELLCGIDRIALPLEKGELKLRVLVDRGVMEVFANDGLVYCPLITWRNKEDSSIALIGSGWGESLQSLNIYGMNSIRK